MLRLTTRGIATAEAIRDREDFRTSGALMGESASVGRYDSGRLYGEDLDQFYADTRYIDYVVTSYATPIAWHTVRGTWYIAKGKWSVTTTKHQSNLYLIKRDQHASLSS